LTDTLSGPRVPQAAAFREGGDRDPKDVALYVHWPYCARICPYCDFNVVRDRGRVEEQAGLVQAILADMEAQASLVAPRRLASIFFGGGTPSLMPPEAVAAVIAQAKALFPPAGDTEITLEANPTDAEAGRYAALAEAGINRLSMGVQSFDDAALKFLGRDHSAAEARRAVETAGRAFPRLSIDLIYARPGQSVAKTTSAGPEGSTPKEVLAIPGVSATRSCVRSESQACASPSSVPAVAPIHSTRGRGGAASDVGGGSGMAIVETLSCAPGSRLRYGLRKSVPNSAVSNPSFSNSFIAGVFG
jgi:hypothetical protein